MNLRLIAALIAVNLVSAHAGAEAAPARRPAQSATARAAIDVANRLAKWQLSRMDDASHVTRITTETRNPGGWEQAVFWIGMTALADFTDSPKMREEIMKMGRRNQWRPAPRPYHADDHAIAQAYLWAARHGAGKAALEPTRKTFDHVLANPPRVSLAQYRPPPPLGYEDIECLKRWCWCDALFMSPRAMVELSLQTGDWRYRDYAMREFWATTDFLYDPAERLFYRDSRFFERRDAQGRKLFWSRGNGWVFAGLARLIPMLERGSADRTRMEGLFREMAGRIKELQKADGYWSPSLLAPEGSPPESSGTAFYTYGLAWGIKSGLLDRESYEPAARRGWAALTRSIQSDGRLGWVQQVSDRPEQVEAKDTQYYGVGAFLLAATAIASL